MNIRLCLMKNIYCKTFNPPQADCVSVRHFIHPDSRGVIHIQSATDGFYRKKNYYGGVY